MLISTLARKKKQLTRVWHVGTLVHMAGDLANSNALYGSVNATMKTTINFYDMATLRYLVIKEKFEQMWVLKHILCERRLVRHYFE